MLRFELGMKYFLRSKTRHFQSFHVWPVLIWTFRGVSVQRSGSQTLAWREEVAVLQRQLPAQPPEKLPMSPPVTSSNWPSFKSLLSNNQIQAISLLISSRLIGRKFQWRHPYKWKGRGGMPMTSQELQITEVFWDSPMIAIPMKRNPWDKNSFDLTLNWFLNSEIEWRKPCFNLTHTPSANSAVIQDHKRHQLKVQGYVRTLRQPVKVSEDGRLRPASSDLFQECDLIIGHYEFHEASLPNKNLWLSRKWTSKLDFAFLICLSDLEKIVFETIQDLILTN